MESCSKGLYATWRGLCIRCLRPLFRSSSAAKRALAVGMEGLYEAIDSMRAFKAVSTLSS